MGGNGMWTVQVSELKARLSHYVETAKNGEEIVITDRGTPVALLRPLERSLRDAAIVNSLVRYGFARPAQKPLTDAIVDARQPPDPTGSVLEALMSERLGERSAQRSGDHSGELSGVGPGHRSMRRPDDSSFDWGERAMSFWDASAIVPLCVNDPLSQQMWELLVNDSTMFAWWGTSMELAVALMGQVRAGTIDLEEMQHALAVAEALRDTWIEIVSSQSIRRHAMKVVRLHALPLESVMQLAAALTWVGYRGPKRETFVSLDPDLRRAAALEGFTVSPPGAVLHRADRDAVVK